jgi:malate dehydrogenase (oxaloacetate-decarboxylating)(NADP+)
LFRSGNFAHAEAARKEVAIMRLSEFARGIIRKAQAAPKRVVFPEGDNEKILRACQLLVAEKIAEPVLVGNPLKIREHALDLDVALTGMQVVDPRDWPRRDIYVRDLFRLRQRKGVTQEEARRLVYDRNYFAALMVMLGDADAMVGGVAQHYPDILRPALQIIRVRPDVQKVSGLFAVVTAEGRLVLIADATVNIDPSAHDLAEIALCAAREAWRFGVEPTVAMLSFSNFGSVRHPHSEKARRAVQIVRATEPSLAIDGEMQADTALNAEVMKENYPFCALQGPANVLICPELQSANIAVKLLSSLGGAEAIGPILMGMRKPVHLLQQSCTEGDVVKMAAIAVLDAQEAGKPPYEAKEAMVSSQ